MAIIKCAACGARISDRYPSCAKCGTTITEGGAKTKSKTALYGGLLTAIVIGLVTALVAHKHASSGKNNVAQTPAPTTAVPVAAQAVINNTPDIDTAKAMLHQIAELETAIQTAGDQYDYDTDEFQNPQITPQRRAELKATMAKLVDAVDAREKEALTIKASALQNEQASKLASQGVESFHSFMTSYKASFKAEINFDAGEAKRLHQLADDAHASETKSFEAMSLALNTTLKDLSPTPESTAVVPATPADIAALKPLYRDASILTGKIVSADRMVFADIKAAAKPDSTDIEKLSSLGDVQKQITRLQDCSDAASEITIPPLKDKRIEALAKKTLASYQKWADAHAAKMQALNKSDMAQVDSVSKDVQKLSAEGNNAFAELSAALGVTPQQMLDMGQ